MPPKKRAAITPSTAGRAKRQKLQMTPNKSPTVDLTARNAVHSPLLCLPAELREAIWKLAFDDQVIVVSYRRRKDGNGRNLSFQCFGTSSGHKAESGAMHNAAESSPKPKLVCRQFWAETSRVFLSSCRFQVNDARSFRELALSKQPVIPHIRRLNVYVWFAPHYFPAFWDDVFTSSLVGRFVGLEGVTFAGELRFNGAITDMDVMKGDRWGFRYLPTLIRSFQQHKLKENLTSVDFWVRNFARQPRRDVVPLNAAIRTQLLEHHPRRLSQRRS
ncbi:hypothetical protein C7974DRAFT_376970 [Boeremia exigua]|uniref:uncharacterized protein n=1 Tax=Boeremia exigua TaxID=749465 RepID=UPI001E8D99A7|nr:uncharacterized protein C7974DRAFT_376970 [Boeremia exigua]KAH6625458.1 hypothetical protein C7974DRAFT_376970 [Boeremia exigua]